MAPPGRQRRWPGNRTAFFRKRAVSDLPKFFAGRPGLCYVRQFMNASEFQLVTRDIALAWRTCLGGWKPPGALTLSGPGPMARLRWLSGSWNAQLRGLEAGFEAARLGHSRPLVQADQLLELTLDPAAAAKSSHAGHLFCSRFSRTDGDKFVRAHLRLLDAGALQGHFAVILGVRAARFQVSPVSSGLLLLAVEAHGAGLPFFSPEFKDLAAAAFPAGRSAARDVQAA